MSEYSHLSVPDLEIAEEMKALTHLPKPQNFSVVRETFKNVHIPNMRKLLEPQLPPEIEYETKDYMIDTEDGSGAKLLARNVVPRKTTPGEKFPVLFWIHGGSWSVGNVDLDDYYLRIISAKLQVSIVNCEYRLAPENPFPIGLNDCYTILKYVAKNPNQFSASLSKGFIVSGSSSGANMAAVLAHRMRDDPLFQNNLLTGQALVCPTVIHPDAYPELPKEYRSQLLSLEQNANAPGWNRASMDMANNSYKAPPSHPDVSPMLFPSHKGLPPAFIQVTGLDPSRDEAFLYEKILRNNDVATKLIVYPGVLHGVEYFFPQSEIVKKFREDFTIGLRWLLEFSSKD